MKISIKRSIFAIITALYLCIGSSVSFADTTTTSLPPTTQTTLSSMKIDRSGNIISASPTSSTTLSTVPATPQTTDDEAVTTANDTTGDGDIGDGAEKDRDSSAASTTTSSTTTTIKQSKKNSSSGSQNAVGASNSSPAATRQDSDKNDGEGDDNADPGAGALGSNSDSGNNGNGGTDGNAGNDSDSENSSSTGDRERSDNGDAGKTVVAGEQVGSAQNNPIGFDVKPYLAIAILLILTVTTIFAARPSALAQKGAIKGRHYKRSGLS